MSLIGSILLDGQNVSMPAFRRYLDAREVMSVKDDAFGARGDAEFPGTGGTDDTEAFQLFFDELEGRLGFVPYSGTGWYKITDQLTIPNNAGVYFEPGAQVLYTDTGTPGAYCIKNGVDGVRGGGLVVNNLSIICRTVTGKGVHLLNSVNSVFNRYYYQGYIPDDWEDDPAGMSARTNTGLRLENIDAECFWNEFNGLWINHAHTGVICPSGDVSTQQFFTNIKLYGDSIYGDSTSIGFDIGSCQDSVVQGGYIEAYPAGISGGVVMTGPLATRWKFRDVVFDHGNYAGSPSIGAVPMNAIRIANSGGMPSNNEFTGCTYTGSCSVVDESAASDGNLIEGNPSSPGAVWTATLEPLGGGSIALTSGAGGDRCYCIKRGKWITIWGRLVVSGVSSPLGRLQIRNLPFVAKNDDGNMPAVTVNAFNLETTGTLMQGYINRGQAQIELECFASGTATSTTAAQIKLATEIKFSVTYAAA